MRQIPHTTLIFERYRIYELRQDVPLSFQFVLALSTTQDAHRYGVTSVTFAPMVVAGPRADNSPHRVPINPRRQGGTAGILSRMYVAIDAIQSINKAAFLPRDLGLITPTEEREVVEKLSAYLGL
ncbi:hypothetical protein [Lewinella sp. JB7]|uniref:hypothetical protein n=1 Tax=Lewinella sp. JB7 TaxID=2962887 RepID=UPI0020C97125|nr:hypothetical protein [Lewinella sp. JB7]MCP9236436.1 hypothetical protein [Lewinella sp. JB7]